MAWPPYTYTEFVNIYPKYMKEDVDICNNNVGGLGWT